MVRSASKVAQGQLTFGVSGARAEGCRMDNWALYIEGKGWALGCRVRLTLGGPA